MKKYIVLSACTALLLMPLTAAHAQTWTTVYDLPNGVCGEMGRNASGHVFAAGRQIVDGSWTATVQESGDLGTNWVVIDAYAEAGLNYAHNRALAVDPVEGNHLFAGGNLNNSLPNGAAEFDALWFIREQDPDTGEWSTADDYSKLTNDVGQASCADIMIDTNGNVYATGGSTLGWVVRKRLVGASTFTTVDPDPDSTGQSSGSGWDMASHPTKGVFVVGEVNGIWTVRRSLNGDLGTWDTVDSFYAQRDWTSGRALCILTTPSKIHVVGSAYKFHNGSHWVVRSSSDEGQTWAITDDYAPSIPSEARGIARDAYTNLWVCGYSIGTAGGSQWVIRKGTPGTKLVKQGKQTVQVETMTWTNIGSPYQLASGKPALPNGITIDAYGNIFVGGQATDANGVDHWIVRRLAAQ